MKTQISVISAVSALALGASAFAGDDKGAADKIRAWYGEAVASYAACDTSAFGKYSAEGHTGYYPDALTLADETSDEARQENIAFCENGGKHEITYDIADVVMLKGAALILGSGHYKRTEPDGTVSIDSDYTFTEVLVKSGDGWKMRHSHIGAFMEMPEGEES